MKLLLDTCSLLWLLSEPGRLSPVARMILENGENQVHFSAASFYEIGLLSNLRRIALVDSVPELLSKAISLLQLAVIPVTAEHAARAGGLPLHHRDPFDRLISAQALVEAVPVVTCDDAFRRFGVTVLW